MSAPSPTTRLSENVAGAGPWTTVGSVTLTSGRFYTMAVTVQCFGGGTLPTSLSFNRGGTWSLIKKQDDTPDLHNIFTYSVTGNGDSGTLTITPSGDVSTKMASVVIEEWAGADTSGAGIVQSASTLSASANPQQISLSLGAPPTTGNTVYVAQSSGSLSSPDDGTNYTELNDISGADYFIEDFWSSGTPTQSPSATATTAFQPQVGVIMEIKSGTSAPAAPVGRFIAPVLLW